KPYDSRAAQERGSRPPHAWDATSRTPGTEGPRPASRSRRRSFPGATTSRPRGPSVAAEPRQSPQGHVDAGGAAAYARVRRRGGPAGADVLGAVGDERLARLGQGYRRLPEEPVADVAAAVEEDGVGRDVLAGLD